MLGLPGGGRIQTVRDVERGARGLDVQMERPGAQGARVQTVEKGHLVAGVVQRLELRRIEEAIGSHAAERQEIPDRARTATKRQVERRALERAVSDRGS